MIRWHQQLRLSITNRNKTATIKKTCYFLLISYFYVLLLYQIMRSDENMCGKAKEYTKKYKEAKGLIKLRSAFYLTFKCLLYNLVLSHVSLWSRDEYIAIAPKDLELFLWSIFFILCWNYEFDQFELLLLFFQLITCRMNY